MKRFLVLLSVAFLISSINCYKSYRNYKLYKVTPNTEQYEAFTQFEYEEGFDFFRLKIAGLPTQVLVAPEKQKIFEEFLSTNKVENLVESDDYGKLLDEERSSIEKRREEMTESDGRANFQVFWRYHEMEAYVDSLVARFPQFIQKEILTISPQGRNIYAVKLSTGVFGQKPIIAMESGMHAREWVCPPTVFYFMEQIITNTTVRNELLSRVDWLIVPMQNPDGYEFTWTNDRMWRQNRRQITPTCIGADLNRNFRYSWRPATITQPCGSIVYPGPFALSEPEDYQLHALIGRYASNIKMYLSVHSFGDFIVWPWSFSAAQHPIAHHDLLHEVALHWRNAIFAATGKDYGLFNSYEYFGNINGSVDDHMIGEHGILLSYTLELTNGFDFRYPEERIFALSQETFHGYRALGLYVANTYGK